LLVDVESTGLDTARDVIIEFGAVPFRYDSTGEVFDVGEPVSYFEDPGRPIPVDIVELTGITDAMVAGQRIDDARVNALLDESVLVIAHNASYDRRILERRLPRFAEKHWGCSRDDVPWSRFGASGLKLQYLLYAVCRVFHDGHRAVDDCLATIHLLAAPRAADGRTPMAMLLDSARRKTSRIWARKSAFETKEVLKARGYRWNDAQKTWFIDRPPAEVEAEKSWLQENVYAHSGVSLVDVTTFTARERYSVRA